VRKTVVLIAGGFSLILIIFHVYLGFKIYGLDTLSSEHRALMGMLNISTALLVFFLAIGSIFFIKDVLTTRIGRFTLMVGFLLYALRAISEVVLFPVFNVGIFVVCVIVAALYLVALLQGPGNATKPIT
jgi:uncharacterized membrane protein YedE/YeeE